MNQQNLLGFIEGSVDQKAENMETADASFVVLPWMPWLLHLAPGV